MQIASLGIDGFKVRSGTALAGKVLVPISLKASVMFRFSVSLPEEDAQRLDLLAERYNHKRARFAGYIILKYLKEHSGTAGTALAPLDQDLQLRLRLGDKEEK